MKIFLVVVNLPHALEFVGNGHVVGFDRSERVVHGQIVALNDKLFRRHFEYGNDVAFPFAHEAV